MATLLEVWMRMQVPASIGAFLLAVWSAPDVVKRARATVRGLEGLLLDLVSLARTARRVFRRRKNRRRDKSASYRSPNRSPGSPGPLRSQC